MHDFTFRDGVMHAEDVAIPAMAEAVGTPFYCYSTASLERRYDEFAAAFDSMDPLICYAIKANSNLAVIRTLGRRGAGADVVSEGEIRRALAAGIAPGKIVFSGVGKTASEMAFALKAGIYGFNVESGAELHLLAETASALEMVARVAIRINPDVDAKTHAKIATGKAGHKFGVSWEEARQLYAVARNMRCIDACGVHVHIGSQITEIEPFDSAFGRVAHFVQTLRADGLMISFVNLGGGLGIPYRKDLNPPPDAPEYANAVKGACAKLDVKLIFEPGRVIVGNAGVLVTRVIYTKETGGKRFAIVDAAMNDLIRPTLYDAYHEIWPVISTPERKVRAWDVVGPVCETGDFFAKDDRLMRDMAAGDLLAIMSAGAYGAVQASAYNSRLLIPEVLVSGGRYGVVRQRPAYEDMLKAERMPPWLEE